MPIGFAVTEGKHRAGVGLGGFVFLCLAFPSTMSPALRMVSLQTTWPEEGKAMSQLEKRDCWMVRYEKGCQGI